MDHIELATRCSRCFACETVLYGGLCHVCRFPPDSEAWKPRAISEQEVCDDANREQRNRSTGRNWD